MNFFTSQPNRPPVPVSLGSNLHLERIRLSISAVHKSVSELRTSRRCSPTHRLAQARHFLSFFPETCSRGKWAGFFTTFDFHDLLGRLWTFDLIDRLRLHKAQISHLLIDLAIYSKLGFELLSTLPCWTDSLHIFV